MKKKYRNIVKVLAGVVSLVILFVIFRPITALAFGSTETLTITFRNGYSEAQGYVEYSLNDGASWVKVTENINNQSITMAGDNLRIRIVPGSNYSVDFAGMSYRENNEQQPRMLNDSANSSIAGGLTSTNGYQVAGTVTSVSLEQVEFSGNNNNNNNNEPNFDGKAYLIWSCADGGICYHYFDNITVNSDGTSLFYKASDVTDDKNNSVKFDVNADEKFFTSKTRFEKWQVDYKEENNVDSINWNNIDIEDLIGPDGVDYQPVGEPNDNNAYVSYGDRNFKVVVYNDDYKGVSIGDLSDLNYYPAQWANPFLRQDQFDLSDTTKAKPTTINTVLLESTVNIKTLNYNGFSINNIEALDVPANAVSINKVNGEWKLVFSSNFYDNVVFKATDSNGEVSYFNVKRYTVDAWINNVENVPHLYAELYFDKNKSYSDFDLTAKIEYKDGTASNVALTAYNKIDDGLGNITETYEVDEENPEFGPSGKGLKKSVFIYKLPNGKTNIDVKKAYINVEYKGSTSTSYAGAFAGSGKGVLANIYQGEEG